MLRAAFAHVVVGLLSLWSLQASAAEQIRDFSVDIFLKQDGSFVVEERIHYDFGAASRHGIYRDIPVRYDRRWGEEYRVRLEVDSVTDDVGARRPYRVQSQGAMLRIRIGDPNRKVTGPQHYWIRYRVERAILFFEEQDELYWNVTGNAWPVGMDAANASVYLPHGQDGAEMETACFTGAQGSKQADCLAELYSASVEFTAQRALRRGEGFTVVVGIPKGVLSEPSGLARLIDRLGDFGGAWLLSPLVAWLFMWQLWRRWGRDPVISAAIPVRYEPPQGMTPAEVGAVIDQRVDVADLSSTILDLAVRGFLCIEEVESSSFLWLSGTDYVLHKLREEGSDLKPYEGFLFMRLFAGRDRVKLSDLRNEFYKDMDEVKSMLRESLASRGGFFVAAPHRVRNGYWFAAAAVAGFAFLSHKLGWLIPPAAIAVGIAGGVVGLFGFVMPRRTRRGRRAYEEILGFREFVQRVDSDRLERSGGRTVENFERVLPYAVVLGVADHWADLFVDLYMESPDWYRSSSSGRFYPRAFVSDVGRSLNSMGRTLVSKPSSSGSGASGLGGGGFSGGGFGGGGGGSW